MIEHNIPQDTWKQLAGNAAAQLVKDGMVIGIGTGSTANYFIYALANRILNEGLKIVGSVPSSQASSDLASNLGVPLTDLDTHPELDLYIDGADEIDPQLHLLKGAGGALLREKVVATAAHSFVVIADITKQVPHLLQGFPLPVEVVPFAITPVRKRLEALGAHPVLRLINGSPFVTDNGNSIVDCAFSQPIPDLDTLHANIKSIVGVVETGFFLHIATSALIGGPDGVKTIGK